MRYYILPVVISLMLAGGGLLAEDERPPIDLPVYPGAEVTMEVNLGAEDIVPMVEATLPLVISGRPELAQVLRPEDLGRILKDVKKVELLQLELDKPKTTLQQIAAHYTAKLPDGRWRRAYYSSVAQKALVVYASPGAEAYYGFRIRGRAVDGRQITQIEVARVVGRIDLPGLVKLAAKLMQASSLPE